MNRVYRFNLELLNKYIVCVLRAVLLAKKTTKFVKTENISMKISVPVQIL